MPKPSREKMEALAYKLRLNGMSDREIVELIERLRGERDEAVGLLRLILSDEGNGVMAWHVDKVNEYLAKLGGTDEALSN